MRHRALTITVLVTVLLVGGDTLILYREHQWLDLLTCLAVLGFWGIVDPRLRGVIVIGRSRGIASSVMRRLARIFEENPPIFLVASCYLVAFIGAATTAGLHIIGVFNLMEAYDVANHYGTLAFLLLTAGVIGQLIWVAGKGKEGNTDLK